MVRHSYTLDNTPQPHTPKYQTRYPNTSLLNRRSAISRNTYTCTLALIYSTLRDSCCRSTEYNSRGRETHHLEVANTCTHKHALIKLISKTNRELKKKTHQHTAIYTLASIIKQKESKSVRVSERE